MRPRTASASSWVALPFSTARASCFSILPIPFCRVASSTSRSTTCVARLRGHLRDAVAHQARSEHSHLLDLLRHETSAWVHPVGCRQPITRQARAAAPPRAAIRARAEPQPGEVAGGKVSRDVESEPLEPNRSGGALMSDMPRERPRSHPASDPASKACTAPCRRHRAVLQRGGLRAPAAGRGRLLARATLLALLACAALLPGVAAAATSHFLSVQAQHLAGEHRAWQRRREPLRDRERARDDRLARARATSLISNFNNFENLQGTGSTIVAAHAARPACRCSPRSARRAARARARAASA